MDIKYSHDKETLNCLCKPYKETNKKVICDSSNNIKHLQEYKGSGPEKSLDKVIGKAVR